MNNVWDIIERNLTTIVTVIITPVASYIVGRHRNRLEIQRLKEDLRAAKENVDSLKLQNFDKLLDINAEHIEKIKEQFEDRIKVLEDYAEDLKKLNLYLKKQIEEKTKIIIEQEEIIKKARESIAKLKKELEECCYKK